MTANNDSVDKPVKHSEDEPAQTVRSMGGPQSAAAAAICRGVTRALAALQISALAELPLPNGRRADVVGLTAEGSIWIVEIKSSIEDFRTDQKWPEYRDFCDRLFFAVRPDFPVAILPEETGLIIADRYGGEIIRPAPEMRLAPARRKAMTLRIGRAASSRLANAIDPSLPLDAALSAAEV